MSVTPTQFAPKVSDEAPVWLRQHLNLIYQKLGNHSQAFALQQEQISTIKSGSSTTTQVVEGGGGGGSVPGVATVGSVNNQSGVTSYTTTTGDNGAFIVFSDASPIAVTLAPQTTPWFAVLVNQGALGSGTVTATPSPSGVTISYTGNPGASSLPILPTYAAAVAFDGTNWWAETFPIVPVNTPAVTHQVLTAYNAATGVFTQGQQSFSDISGTAAINQGGTGTGSTLAGLVRGGSSAFTASELSGDATTSGSNAVTVVKVNGGSVPASQPALASNGSSQIVGATTTGSGSVVLNNAPALSGAVTDSGSLAMTATSGTLVTMGNHTGLNTSTPAAIDMGLSFATDGTKAAEIKLMLGTDGANQYYGIGVGSVAEMNFHINKSGSGGSPFYRWFILESEFMRLISNGHLLLGTTSDNGSLLQVSGSASFSSAISFPGVTGATVTGSSTAGAGSALPATPQGYLSITINGSNVKIPYYNP